MKQRTYFEGGKTLLNPGTLAYAEDGYAQTSDYTPHVADMHSHETFGCVMHEPKE